MALIKCSECGGQVSSRAVRCPHCGAPTVGSSPLALGVAAGVLGLAAAMGLLLSRGGGPDQSFPIAAIVVGVAVVGIGTLVVFLRVRNGR